MNPAKEFLAWLALGVWLAYGAAWISAAACFDPKHPLGTIGWNECLGGDLHPKG